MGSRVKYACERSVVRSRSAPPNNLIMELSNKKISFPWWFSLILFLLVSPIFFVPLIAFVNPSFFGGEGVTELNLGITLFIARNLAIGLAFIFAIFIKNGPMLFVLILVRLITDLIDAPAFQFFREPPLVAQMIIFTCCVIYQPFMDCVTFGKK